MNTENSDDVTIVSSRPTGSQNGARPKPKSSASKAGEIWLFIGTIRQRLKWMILSAFLFAAIGFAASWILFKPSYMASARLVRTDSPRIAAVFNYQTLTPQTFASLLKSPELMERVAKEAKPSISADRLVKSLRLTPEREGDVVLVEAAGPSKDASISLANLYAKEAVLFTQELQANAAQEVDRFIVPQVAQLDIEIAALKNKDRSAPKATPVTIPTRPSPLALKVQAAREELIDALTRYTDTHPVVQSARAKVESLQSQLTNNTAQAVSMPTEAELVAQLNVQRDAWEMLRSELQPLEQTRRELIGRQRAAKLVADEPPGYYRVFAEATPRDVKGGNREIKVAAVTVFFGVAGFFAAMLLALLVEVADKRIKVPADVTRVTGLPMIGTAPDLAGMPESRQRDWAFQTWTKLQGRLSPSLNHGLVCGITSSAHGEGRSTWVKLLARAASESGFRVLTVTARHPDANGHTHPADHNNPVPGSSMLAVNSMNTLPSPLEVEHKLVGPQSQPVVHIPLPGWVWNLDRRKQWQSALDQWRKIDNVVILIELPPASVSETVLLAEELPNLVWLSESGSSKADETRAQLEVLRSARCKLVGAVLNRISEDPLRKRLARWLPTTALLLLMAQVATAQTNVTITNAVIQAAPAANTGGYFMGSSANAPRSAWQKRFTLGPGDTLTIALYGQLETSKREMVVAPDGRVSFMEVADVMAGGLTVDEFRTRLDEELGKYRRAARTIVTPVAFRSKKYAVLGKVAKRGVYSLDHPITVLEAVARAQGFEVGLRERDSIDLVDLQHAFLMRGGKRFDVNFEKMFLDGDLSQNIVIEPGDYLFFPSMSLLEVHVLGDVRYPGPVTHTPNLTVMGAIAQRAGFNDTSYKTRVLVIRGSINKPETFVIDSIDILQGKAPDFKLQPKDIVYVSKKPWYRADDLVELAITAFIQSVVSSSVSQDIMVPFNP